MKPPEPLRATEPFAVEQLSPDFGFYLRTTQLLAERRSARRGTLIYRMESAAGEPSVIAQKPMMSSAMTESAARS